MFQNMFHNMFHTIFQYVAAICCITYCRTCQNVFQEMFRNAFHNMFQSKFHNMCHNMFQNVFKNMDCSYFMFCMDFNIFRSMCWMDFDYSICLLDCLFSTFNANHQIPISIGSNGANLIYVYIYIYIRLAPIDIGIWWFALNVKNKQSSGQIE